MHQHIRTILPALFLFGCAQLKAPAETNFGEVGMRVMDLLQSNHISRKPFDDEMSAATLETYLRFLDFNRQYFLGSDVESFRKEYGEKLDDALAKRDLSPAHAIYDLYETRVKERFEKIRSLLEETSFTFDSDRTVQLSRKDATWPASVEEADQLWHDIIENELLQEKLRDIQSDLRKEERAARKEEQRQQEGLDPAEEGAEEPAEEDSASANTAEEPTERILKRYRRFVESLDENDTEEVVDFFLSSLAATYDPHSDYFSQSETDNFDIQMRKNLQGIGALLSMEDGAAEIKGIVVGGPADKQGELALGDRIVAVGEGSSGELVDVMFMKLQKVVELIRGNKGTTVRLKVIPAAQPDGSVTKMISIVRDEVELKDSLASAELIEIEGADGTPMRVGWISLPSFYLDMQTGETSCTADTRRLLVRLMKEGVEGVVLDLRGNGGGSLDEAIRLTGLFIPKGPVVQAKDWQQNVTHRDSNSPEALYTGPLAVLTDKSSASASEIVAAALQDYGRAVILGESSTFGKGTVQTILPMSNYMGYFQDRSRAGALKVTIQKFYRINGGSTQLKGVVPDLHFPSVRDALDLGEEALDRPLPWDQIDSRDFAAVGAALPIDALLARHLERMETDPEFAYIIEDRERIRTQRERNEVSLNLEERLAQLREDKALLDARKADRIQRVKELGGESESTFTSYRLTLDNVDDEELALSSSFSDADSSGMRLAAGDDEDTDEPVSFPYDLEPVKLETIRVLTDLIEIGNGTLSPEIAKDAPAQAAKD